jgi:hypothetical protein
MTATAAPIVPNGRPPTLNCGRFAGMRQGSLKGCTRHLAKYRRQTGHYSLRGSPSLRGLLSVFERQSHGVSGETRRRMQAPSQLQQRQVKSTQRV